MTGPSRPTSDELRLRCGQLRDLSRDLRVRSQQCRERLAEAARGVESAVSTLAEVPETGGAARVQRLVRAETDLKAAIAECSAALAEVRRELDWRHPSPIVH